MRTMSAYKARPTTEILHAVPGRLRMRFRDRCARDPERVTERLRQIPAVGLARHNPLTGSLIVEYDARRITAGAILTFIDALPAFEAATHRERSVADDGLAARNADSPVPTLWERFCRWLADLIDLVRTTANHYGHPLKGRKADLVPYLPKVASAAVALASARGPFGVAAAGLESIQLAAEIHALLVA